MRFIGVHLGHDNGVVVINEHGQITFYGQTERYSRKKNHSGYDLKPLADAFPDLQQLQPDDFCVLVSIGGKVSNEEFWNNIHNVSEETTDIDTSLARMFKPAVKDNFLLHTLGRNPDMVIHHHLAHAVTAWCYRPDDTPRPFLIYDGAGIDCFSSPRSSLVGEIGPDYVMKHKSAVDIPSSVPLTSLLGYNSAGKAMGLAGFIKNKKIDPLEFLKTTVKYTMCEPKYTPRFLEIPDRHELTRDKREFIGSFYQWYTQDIIWPAVEENITKFALGKSVLIGGGTTLALELNTRIHNMCGDVVFAPPTDDSGCALGAAAFAYWFHTRKWIKINTPSLNELQSPLEKFGPQSPEEIAKLLANGKVVGLLRGKSEAGPRALGFRSILASAKNKNNLRRVSQEIKRREYYRPLAPMVTEEQFDRFFTGPKGKYMQYRNECTEECKELLPAICHKDGSARPQVVYKQDDPWLHRLLTTYGEISGVECLINTSLNGKNRPICSTLEDAQKDMAGKDILLASLPQRAWRPKFEFI